MKTVKLVCQNCGANLDVEGNIAFCGHCGAKLALDDENRTTTHNHNYNHTYIQRDETRIKESDSKENLRLKELEYEERKEKRDTFLPFIIIGIVLCLFLVGFIVEGIYKWNSEAQGKICAGYYEDYIDENYEAVVEQFKEMGFEDIVTVDLKDSGLAFWNDGKVKSVSINGDDSFGNGDYFYPDDKVIIKYH